MTKPEPHSDVDRARELLETAKLQNFSDRMLAAAQVHATLAVEAAVRELIDKLEAESDH
jgi:hypothetical protein